MRSRTLATLCVAAAVASCGGGGGGGDAAEPRTVALTEAESNQTVGLKVGEVAQVTLVTTRSTGSSWRLAVTPPGVVTASDPVVVESGDRPGASGKDRYSFTAERPGTATAVFLNNRWFESSLPPSQTVTYHFVVQ